MQVWDSIATALGAGEIHRVWFAVALAFTVVAIFALAWSLMDARKLERQVLDYTKLQELPGDASYRKHYFYASDDLVGFATNQRGSTEKYPVHAGTIVALVDDAGDIRESYTYHHVKLLGVR